MSDLPIPQIVNSLDVDEDKAYEPPYSIRWGVNRETTGTNTITMGRTIIPPPGPERSPLSSELRHDYLCRERTDQHLLQRRRRYHVQGDQTGPFRLFPAGLHPRAGESKPIGAS